LVLQLADYQKVAKRPKLANFRAIYRLLNFLRVSDALSAAIFALIFQNISFVTLIYRNFAHQRMRKTLTKQ